MAYAPSADSLNPLIEKMSAHILKAAELNECIDLAFVVDTTSSMGPYIEEIQQNLVRFLSSLQESAHFRVALLEFRDRGGSFLNQIDVAFTTNLDQVAKAVPLLVAGWGAPDIPEAVLDALLAAKDKLEWNAKAKRIVILIGDAPPHPKTADGLHDEAAVIARYQASGTQVAVYPVFAET